MAHRNARLPCTADGCSSRVSSMTGVLWRMWSRNSAALGRRDTNGWPAGEPKATPDSWTGPHRPPATRQDQPRPRSTRVCAAYRTQTRPTPARSAAEHARHDRARRTHPPRPAPPPLARSAHRHPAPTLRTRPARRTAPRRRQKIGRLRDGGGWRVHGRDSDQARQARTDQLAGHRVGYEYVHAAIDDHTRLAYAEIHPDEKTDTCAGFLRRAAAHFAQLGIPAIERVMTHNAMAYRRGHAWHQTLHDLGAQARFTRAYRPQTNCQAWWVLFRDGLTPKPNRPEYLVAELSVATMLGQPHIFGASWTFYPGPEHLLLP